MCKTSQLWKIVSVDVVSKTEEKFTGWAGVYDYAELGEVVAYFIHAPVLGSKSQAADGTLVIFAGGDRAGIYIFIKGQWEGKDLYLLYGHLSRPLKNQGDRVKAGEPVAISGDTGYSTGPHLHFEIRHG